MLALLLTPSQVHCISVLSGPTTGLSFTTLLSNVHTWIPNGGTYHIWYRFCVTSTSRHHILQIYGPVFDLRYCGPNSETGLVTYAAMLVRPMPVCHCCGLFGTSCCLTSFFPNSNCTTGPPWSHLLWHSNVMLSADPSPTWRMSRKCGSA
jgi:hypothetical protein